jgi:hypothetical protein
MRTPYCLQAASCARKSSALELVAGQRADDPRLAAGSGQFRPAAQEHRRGEGGQGQLRADIRGKGHVAIVSQNRGWHQPCPQIACQCKAPLHDERKPET